MSLIGDIVFARLFQTPVLVLNSVEVARLLLEKRGSKYSDRPRFVKLLDVIGWTYNFSLRAYEDPDWRRQRKWFQAAFQARNGLNRYRSLQQDRVQALMRNLVESPEAFMGHVKTFSASLMMEVAYGRNVLSSLDENYLENAEKAMLEIFQSGSFAGSLVDYFPTLKYWPVWLPGGQWKRQALDAAKSLRVTIQVPYERFKEFLATGNAESCFISSIMSEISKTGEITEEDEKGMKDAAIVLYSAGTDTTITTILMFIQAMVLHPDIYLKAQTEVDAVIGDSRLPTIEDKDSLPYLDCVIKEVYRWGCPVPLGLPHQLTVDDEFRGYHHPARSTVITNIWYGAKAMTHNSDIYPSPDRFDPERYIGLNPEDAERLDPRKMAFGFGRRICPGRFLGDSTAILVAATMLATLDIRKARDAAGAEITPMPEYFAGGIS
ncbi:uncharacterized protein FIBRA_04133 [Fibroporia radiculosa]|uniref:Cytochrome P450 n=1 Tax=Fibroporia radiculosa TaxID=599839 RepID=J4HWD2_9APHY|nr:uncharacterized protein FIBRA_04133 [Fibroporia radiculosa]CCM02057.1 predicted protein [Fibroporia radiculosa]